MDKFIAQQRLLYPLSDESVLKLTEGMEEVFAPKGSFPVYEGDRDPYVWFVKEGLARSFVERDMARRHLMVRVVRRNREYVLP